MNLKIIDRIADIPAAQWNTLAGDNPFLCHAFLLALQECGCTTAATGWQPQFLTLWQDGQLAGAMPLYLKHHSYGEFVFDWAWAEAYHQHGLRYYPKLLCAVPFVPVAGLRILSASAEVRTQLINEALQLAQKTGLSSFHCLFPNEQQALDMQQHGMMLRRGVQLHWHNPGYADFDGYLAALRRDKRKKVNYERRQVKEAGIRFERIRGEQATDAHWEFFMRCYTRTLRLYNSPQPLNLAFFKRIGETMPHNILLIVASLNGQAIACAINFYTRHALYGRSWGTLQYHAGLHFETCYYQAIEFCIEQGITTFEGGAQGEHKLARGFLPVTTWSAHWLQHPEFSRAVENFLQREAGSISQYVDELNDSNPFKNAARSQ